MQHDSDSTVIRNQFGGSWSVKKLNCIEKYLESYLMVMKEQEWANLWYIDAFSGEGYQALKSSISKQHEVIPSDDSSILEFTEGSALRALRVSEQGSQNIGRGFQNYVFLEINQRKINSLQERIGQKYPSQLEMCRFIQEDVNVSLPELLSKMNWCQDRAVVFIDPFATELKWSTIEAFNDTCVDVWLLFPLSGITRMMPTKKMPPERWAERLDSVFGDTSWRNLYNQSEYQQPDLFGNVHDIINRDQGTEQILDYATERFKKVFPGVNGYAVINNDRGAPLFALYSLVSNPSKKAIDISSRISTDLLSKLNAG